ncbi:hypothetical protein NL676_032972 [Syzygium grande]|nr:hypothetical protein NL676_032972 [Syzygium grande]
MEALSSLITRQKRETEHLFAGKFGKLERMSIYLRLVPYPCELSFSPPAGATKLLQLLVRLSRLPLLFAACSRTIVVLNSVWHLVFVVVVLLSTFKERSSTLLRIVKSKWLEEEPPTDPTSQEEWKVIDAALRTLLWGSMAESIRHLFMDCTTAREVWTKCALLYSGQNNMSRVCDMWEALFEAKIGDAGLGEYYARFSSLYQRLKSYLPPATTVTQMQQREANMVVVLFLRGLGPVVLWWLVVVKELVVAVVVVVFRAEVPLVVVVVAVLKELVGFVFVLIVSIQDILLIIATTSILSYGVYMFQLLHLDHRLEQNMHLLTSASSASSTSVTLADGSQSKVTGAINDGSYATFRPYQSLPRTPIASQPEKHPFLLLMLRFDSGLPRPTPLQVYRRGPRPIWGRASPPYKRPTTTSGTNHDPVPPTLARFSYSSPYPISILGLEEKIAGLKIIHVAGTKGKGSTCAFCEAILRKCGFRTGLFTCPHLMDDEEAAGLELPSAFVRGLSTARLSGRAQIVHDNGSADTSENSGELTFYLDGAYSPESMEACARWFSVIVGKWYLRYEKDCLKSSNKTSKQILLFNCMDVRDPQILLPRLVNICASSDVSLDKSSKTDSVDSLPPHDFLYADVSHGSLADQNFASSAGMPSLPLTIKWLRDCVKEKPSLRLQVLVTCSLHLVGDVLKLLRR